MRRKINKKEKQGILFLLIGVIVFAFITNPVTNFVQNVFGVGLTSFIIGLIILIGLAWYGRLNQIFK